MIEASKQMLLTIYQFNEYSFYFEQTRSIECLQNNRFESSICYYVLTSCVFFDRLINNGD